MVYQEGSRVSTTGAKLFTASYQPEGAAQAALVFHHGLGEHIGRYTGSELPRACGLRQSPWPGERQPGIRTAAALKDFR